MISGLSNVSLSPETNISHLWRDQATSNHPRKIAEYVSSFFGHVGFGMLDVFGKVCPTHLEMSAFVFE